MSLVHACASLQMFLCFMRDTSAVQRKITAFVGLSHGIFRAVAFFGTDALTGSYAVLLRIHVTVNCFQGNRLHENSYAISLVSLFSIC